MKQKIKGKNCAVFCFAGKRFFIYLGSDYMGICLKRLCYLVSTLARINLSFKGGGGGGGGFILIQ
jgi:hypothetical protein